MHLTSSIGSTGPHPTVVSVYGGPHVQKVNRCWALTVDMMAQRLRDLGTPVYQCARVDAMVWMINTLPTPPKPQPTPGILVVKCDNRGSARRGLRFEAPLRQAFGTVEVRDQEDAVKLLVRARVRAMRACVRWVGEMM